MTGTSQGETMGGFSYSTEHLSSLPTDLSEALEEAPATREEAGAEHGVLRLVALGCEVLRCSSDLALAEYVTALGDLPQEDPVRQHLANAGPHRLVGSDAQLLLHCWRGLKGRPGRVLSFNFSVSSSAVGQCCAFWRQLRETGRQQRDRIETFQQFAHARPAKKEDELRALLDCFPQIRALLAHHGKITNLTRGAEEDDYGVSELKVRLNPAFYAEFGPLLCTAWQSLLDQLVPDLARFHLCTVGKVSIRDGTHVAPVTSTRRVRPTWEVAIPNPVAYREGSSWYVDTVTNQFCFAEANRQQIQVQKPEPVRRETGSLSKAPASLASIKYAVKQRLFTPVLGPACYRLEDNLIRGRAHVENRKALFLQMRPNAKEKAYLESVIRSRLDNHGLPVRPGEARDVAPAYSWEKDQLLSLQYAVVRLGVALTERFAEALGKAPVAVTDLAALTVTLDEGGVEQVRTELDAACLAADALCAVASVQRDELELGLGAGGIRRGLRKLQSQIFGSRETIVAFSVLEWIGDLLYHTLRFRAPMYPAPDELAFQIAVCLTPAVPPRRYSVGDVAAPVEVEPLISLWETLRAWLEIWSRRSRDETSEPSRFHVALARAMCHGLTTPLREGKPRPTFEEIGTDDEYVHQVPVVIDTNLDCELERVFEASGRPYHVVLPVEVKGTRVRDGKSVQENTWVAYSCDGTNPTWTLLADPSSPAHAHSKVFSLKDLDPRGPILVKTNGAPLTPVPRQSTWREKLLGSSHLQIMALSPRVIMSHTAIVRAIGEDVSPPGLKDLLGEQVNVDGVWRGRVFCLLGFPLTDSSNRLHIYDLHRRAELQSSSRIIYVDELADPILQSFLSLTSCHVAASLHAVTEEIEQSPGLAPLWEAS